MKRISVKQSYKKFYDSDKGSFDPLDSFYWAERAFLEFLQKNELIAKDEVETFSATYKLRFEEAKEKVSHLIRNEMDKGNVYFTLIAVASYEAFLEMGKSKEEAMVLTDKCLNMPTRAFVIEGTRKMLDSSSDPFKSIVKASKDREASFFGESFDFERLVDNEFGYILHVRKCLFHLVLKTLGRQELQPSLCRLDLGWINAIDPGKHHMTFVRPVTFATGNICQMWFIRKEKEILKDHES